MTLKINKDKIKQGWKRHKFEVLGVGCILLSIGGVVYARHVDKSLENDGDLNPLRCRVSCQMPTRKIPNTEGFKILDIGEDINDGCITWLDGCKLSDCGKLGEGLSKIERVDPNMFVTMAILAKEDTDL